MKWIITFRNIIKASNIEKINVFNSPIEALEYLAILQSNQENFLMPFSDINMPDMDGFGFLMNILNSGRYR
jgi:CheY-like chemotaxis protein